MSKQRLIWFAALSVVIAATTLLFATRDTTEPSGVPLPNSMAAIGDSITAAVAMSAEEPAGAPQHSWATGTDGSDAVASHSERLVEAGALEGASFNNSVSGATMADAMPQVEATVEQNVDYVVFLLGANDVCAPSTAAMTAVADFETLTTAALDRLATGSPDAAIYVLSIPNVYRLWEVGSESIVATTIWNNAGICQSVLGAGLSDDARQAALERTEQFNAVLAAACARHPNCRFDANAVFGHDFGEDEIGPLDHFHPSENGQAALAEVSWEAGFWPEL